MIIDRRDIFGQALSDKAFGCKVMRCLSFLIVLNLSGALYAAVKTPGSSTGTSETSAGAIDESKPQSPTLFRLERYKEFLEELGKDQGESTGRSQKKGSKVALSEEQKLQLQPVIDQINKKIEEITQGWPIDGSQANIRYVAEWFNHFVAHHSWSMTTLIALPPLIAAMSYLVPAASGIYGVHGLFLLVNNMALFAHQQATTMVCSYLAGSAIKQTTGYKLVGAGAIVEKMIRKYFISFVTGSFLKTMYNDSYLFPKAEKGPKVSKDLWDQFNKVVKPVWSGAKTFLKEGGIQVSGIPTMINSYYAGVSTIAGAWKKYPEKLVAQTKSMYMDFTKGSPLLQLYQFLALSDKQLSTGLVGETEQLPAYLLSFDGVRSFKPTPGSMAAAIKFRAAIRNAERLVEQSRYYSQNMLNADKQLFEESLLNAPDSAESINQTEKDAIKKTLEKDREEIIKAMKKN